MLVGGQLTGSIPPELGGLPRLEVLSLYGNQLTGSIPPELGNLFQLRFLTLYGNQLTGGIPPELGNLSQLEFLRLHDNRLTGSIPARAGNLSHLEVLSLHDNQLDFRHEDRFHKGLPPELRVTRPAESTDATLKDLTVTGVRLEPAFPSGTMSHTASVGVLGDADHDHRHHERRQRHGRLPRRQQQRSRRRRRQCRRTPGGPVGGRERHQGQGNGGKRPHDPDHTITVTRMEPDTP